MKQIIAPSTYPVTVKEVADYMKVDLQTENDLVEQLIKTAIHVVESYIGLCLAYQQWQMCLELAFARAWSDTAYVHFQSLTGNKGIVLSKAPFHSLEGSPLIQARDETKRSVEAFRLDTSQRFGRLHVDLEHIMPSDRLLLVSYWVGYDVQDVPPPLKIAICELTLMLYKERGEKSPTPLISSYIRSLLDPYKSYTHSRSFS